jgi:DNA-binding CsgD family transcriptional regulator
MLLRHAQQSVQGMLLLVANGVESESAMPFAGLNDLLRLVLDRVSELPEPQAVALAGALAIAPAVPGDRFLISVATLGVLTLAAERQPVLAVIDDIQWLDIPSAEAILFAARRLGSERIVMLFGERTHDTPAVDLSGISELRLQGLSLSDSAAVLAEVAGCAVPMPISEQIHAAVGGNPLALREIPNLLTIRQLDGTEPLPDPLPAGRSLELVFERRVRQFTADSQTALVVAAAYSGSVPGVIGDAIARLGVEPSAFDVPEAAGLVAVLAGRLTFCHPLHRSAAYHAASPSAQRAAHRALAEALNDRNEDERAWHLAAATIGPDETAAAAIEQAAANARQRGAYAVAIAAFDRAASLTDDREERARRLLEGAGVAAIAGRASYAIQLLDSALGCTTSAVRRADIELLRGQTNIWMGQPMAAHERLLAEAARVADIDPKRAVTMLTAAAAPCVMAGRLEIALATSEKAVQLARALGGSPMMVAELHRAQALILLGLGAEAQPILRSFVPRLDEPEFWLDMSQFVPTAAQQMTWVEEYETAHRLLTPIVSAARAAGAAGVLPYVLGLASDLNFRTGHWSIAYAQAAEGVDLAAQAAPSGPQAFCTASLARIEAATGRDADCRANVRSATDLAQRFGIDSILTYCGSALGLLELGIGNPYAAVQALEPVARHVAERHLNEPAVVQWAPDLIESYIRTGQVQAAVGALSTFERQAEATGRVWAVATAARCRGLLASADAFEDEFELALAEHERTPTPFERARTLLCYGEALRRHRRRADARLPLRRALATFDQLGAEPWAARTRAELRSAGESPRQGAPIPSRSLTPQELQVALAVAEGATNREVAAGLFLSAKTVETHLGHAFAKLQVRSRTELARRLFEQPASSV